VNRAERPDNVGPTSGRLGEDPLSGLIYAVLVAVWAAVLVPMWLRRHDAITESRSVDRFSTAMRVLARRPLDGGSRHVVQPSSAAEAQERPVPARRRFPVLGTTAGRSRPRDARAQLRERRARVLGVLAALAALTLLLALAGVTGWSLHLLVDLLLIGYVVHLRVQVVKAAPIALRLPVARLRPEPAYAQERVATPAVAEQAPAMAPVTASSEQGWVPNPVPLPTYVTAPVAPRPARERPQPAPAADPFQPDDAEIEVLFERRWAVND